MRKHLPIAFIAFFCVTSLHAQFMRTYSNAPGQGVRFAALVPVIDADPVSNMYMAGSNEGYLLVGEMEQDGDFVWTRRINAKDTSLIINQMIKDSDGNLVMVGTAIAGDLGKAFILKFDPVAKTVVWFRRCTSNTFFWDVAEMGSGGDYVVGGQESWNGTGTGTDDLTLKFKRVSGAVSIITNLNKNLNESVEAVVYDDVENVVYTTGRYELSGGVSKFRIGLNKVQTDGTVDWTRGYIKSTASSGRFYSEDMIRDGDHLVIVGAGDDAGTNTVKNLWFIKTDLDGEAVITKKLDVTGTSYDGLIAGIRKFDDGYILYGSLHNGTKFTDAFLISVDIDGNVNWSKSYPFRLRTPTTGLYCSSAMTILGENIFVVGEKLNDVSDLEGVLVKVSVETGELSTCDADFPIVVTTMTNYDEYFTLDTATVMLSFPNSFPGVKPVELSFEHTCNPNGLVHEDNARQTWSGNEQEIVVYPNPAGDIVYIELPGQLGSEFSYTIRNLNGQIACTGIITDGMERVNMEGWSAGTYFVEVHGLPEAEVRFIRK